MSRSPRATRCRSSSPASSRSTCSKASDDRPAARSGRAEVENQYRACCTRDGNTAAQKMIDKVFEVGRPQVARHRHDSEERLPAE